MMEIPWYIVGEVIAEVTFDASNIYFDTNSFQFATIGCMSWDGKVSEFIVEFFRFV